MKCFDYSSWCSGIASYCAAPPVRGKCSKADYWSRSPPQGGSKPAATTTVYPCAASSTSTSTWSTSPAQKPTTTPKPYPWSKTTTTTTPVATQCPIPTLNNICTQPSNRGWGYGPGNPVGGIELPVVTCNDLSADYGAGNQFKLYTDQDSYKCASYTRPRCGSACADACKAQFDHCSTTYVQACKSNGKSGGYNKVRDTDGANYFDYAASPSKRGYGGWTDSWTTASTKCQQQYQDCLSVNKYVTGNGKCSSYGSGW